MRQQRETRIKSLLGGARQRVPMRALQSPVSRRSNGHPMKVRSCGHSLWEMLQHSEAPFWKCLRYICIYKLLNNPEVKNIEEFYLTQFFLDLKKKKKDFEDCF